MRDNGEVLAMAMIEFEEGAIQVDVTIVAKGAVSPMRTRLWLTH